MPHNHQCYTLGNHCAKFHPIPSVGRNQSKFPIPCKSPFEKYQRVLYEKIQFLEVKFSTYLNRRVFVMQAGDCIRHIFSSLIYFNGDGVLVNVEKS